MTKKKWTTTFNYGAISLILCGKAETSKNSEGKVLIPTNRVNPESACLTQKVRQL